MFKKIIHNHSFLAAAISLAYILLALPISEAVAFTQPTDAASRHFMYLAKGIFFFVLLCVTRLIIYFVTHRGEHGVFAKRWLRYGAISFVLVFFVFILIYPGHWVWDEFNILNAVKHYQPDAWQNIFTNIYYTICLYIYPTGVSIVFFQILIASIVMGYVLAVARKYIHTPWLVYLLLIPFASPVLLINDLYPLRLTIYSYCELALLTLLLDSYLDRTIREKKILFAVSAFLITLLCLWRTEGIFYLLVLPVAMQRFKIVQGIRKQDRAAIAYTVVAIIIIASGYMINKHYSSSRYALTAIINPLSVMIQSPLAGPSTQKDLAKINQVVNLEIVKKQPSYIEVPSYWGGAVRPDYEQHLQGFYAAYLDLVLHNPKAFFSARINTFLAANGLDSTTPTPMSLLSYQHQFTSGNQAIVDRFYDTNLGARPLNFQVRYNLSRTLLMLDPKDHVSVFGNIVWSIIPTLTILIALAVFFAVRRLWVLLAVCILLLLRAVLVFLTAPASYFMYFLPIYLCGNILIIFFAIHLYREFSQKDINALRNLT